MNRFLFLTIYRGYFVAIVARVRANRIADRETVLVTKVDTLDFKLWQIQAIKVTIHFANCYSIS